jgi:3-dehydroquinate synthase
LVGAIIPPDRVIIDPTFLKTLPKRELVSGLAELLKYGLISSPELWKRTSRSLRRLLRGFDTGYESLIRSAIAIKKSFVEEDEYETKIGIREVLNFGHTIGHALEAVNGFERVLHGEAVALGVRCAAYISHNYGSLSHDDWRDIEQTFGRFPIPDGLNLDPSKIIEAIQYDKKQKQEGIRMILLTTIGKPVITNVSEFQVRSALQFIADVI